MAFVTVSALALTDLFYQRMTPATPKRNANWMTVKIKKAVPSLGSEISRFSSIPQRSCVYVLSLGPPAFRGSVPHCTALEHGKVQINNT